jgi:tRNA (guanine37-N1)-methyltransferase
MAKLARRYIEYPMTRIDIISVQPQLMESPLNHSIVQRAKDKGLVEIVLHNLKDFGLGNYKQVDDAVYGGGAGMVIRCEPVFECVNQLKKERAYDEIIYMCPDGDLYDQKQANQLSLKKNMIILCGHYKGIDQRIRDHLITKEISIGSYVLSGGEIAAVAVADSICRLIPGVISDEESALTDSFQDNLLAPPVYTRPADYKGWKVPEILQSGHFAKIEEWRYNQALKITQERRPDLLDEDNS